VIDQPSELGSFSKSSCGFSNGGHYLADMPIDDAELLQQFVRDRRDDVFAELVNRYIGLVYNAALRQVGGDSHAAQDVTQSVFALLAQKAPTLTRHPSIAGWLHTTARFAARDWMRSQRRRLARETEAQVMQEILSDDRSSRIEWSQIRPALDDALGALNEHDREVVLLRFFAGRRLGDIGQQLQLSENAVRMRVDRALGKLQTQLVRRGITSTAAALGLALTDYANAAVPTGMAGTVAAHAVAAAPAVTSQSAALTFSIMNVMKLAGTVIAGALLISAVAVSVDAVRARRDAEAVAITEEQRNQIIAQQRAAMEKRAAGAETELAALKRQAAAQISAGAGGGSGGTTASASPPAQPEEFDPGAAGDAFLSRHPEVKEALGQYVRARVDFRFGELYRKLNLTPEQIRHFQDLVGRAGMGSDTADGREMQLLWKPAEPAQNTHNELQALLGDEGMRLYEELNRQEATRMMTVHITGALALSESPLTPLQADRLTEVLMANRPTPPAGSKSPPRVDWDAVIVQALGFLAPQQIAILEGERAHDVYNRVLFHQ
jgi:RNA polymerase sigma factor (sigma-70 family)